MTIVTVKLTTGLPAKNSFVDFLGNTVEVGDLVVYAPKDSGAELVMAELLELRPVYTWQGYYDDEGHWHKKDVVLYKPFLQPLLSTWPRRGSHYVRGEGYVPGPMRKVLLSDCSTVILHNKKEVTE